MVFDLARCGLPGSTTTSGIVKRIDHRLAARLGKEDKCVSFEEHIQHLNGPGERFGKRDRSSSFLLSSIRNPLKRAISRMVFSPICKIRTWNFKEKLLGDECDSLSSHQYGIHDFKRSGFQVAYTIFNVSDEVSVYNKTRPDEVGNVDLATSYVRQIMEGTMGNECCFKDIFVSVSHASKPMFQS